MAAEQVGSPTTEKILQSLHAEAKKLLASRADEPFVAHLSRLASELPGRGWQRLTPHLLHNPLPQQGRGASGPSRAELIAACTVCDEYGQIEMADGAVANCRHRNVTQPAA
ncbi:hypothetical protein [Streptomyces sp. NPDC048196]|uniref:hypothetical protein n=1 Tax=Streptomyces sp. NPDC048196 TaxID=3154712 RepID=UPI0033CB0506